MELEIIVKNEDGKMQTFQRHIRTKPNGCYFQRVIKRFYTELKNQGYKIIETKVKIKK